VYGKDFDKWGGEGLRVALYMFDPERLEAGLPAGSAWDREAFDAAVEADIVAWLERERASRRWELPGSPEQISEKLREFGFSHLTV
jgi:hypothetical protein